MSPPNAPKPSIPSKVELNEEPGDSKKEAQPVASILAAKTDPEEELLGQDLVKARSGDAQAQYKIGCAYYEGKGVSQDDDKAFEWFSKSALQKDLNAQKKIKEMFAQRRGLFQDDKQALSTIKKAARKKDAVSQMILGWMYEEGRGIKQDHAKAFIFHKRAARKKLALAQYEVGKSYAEGRGLNKDSTKAAKWYKRAATQGYAEARNNLQDLSKKLKNIKLSSTTKPPLPSKDARPNQRPLLENIGFEAPETLFKRGNEFYSMKNYAKAKECWEKAAVQGHVDAQYELGSLYYNGCGVPQDYFKAKEWLEKAVAGGYGDARIRLKNAIDHISHSQSIKSAATDSESPESLVHRGMGFYVNNDYVRAKECYEKAASKGYAGGQHMMGVLYYFEYAVVQDYAKAKKWYEKAAAQGNANSQHALGGLYKNGKGVPRNYFKAKEWYEKAAAQNHDMAQISLKSINKKIAKVQSIKSAASDIDSPEIHFKCGNEFYNMKNYGKAKECWEKAAAQNHAGAANNIGKLFFLGEGTPKDYLQAKKWFEKAAIQGFSNAQSNMGILYNNGWGVRQDYAKTKEWFEKAAAQGHVKAQMYIKNINVEISKDQNLNQPEYSEIQPQYDVQFYNTNFFSTTLQTYCTDQKKATTGNKSVPVASKSTKSTTLSPKVTPQNDRKFDTKKAQDLFETGMMYDKSGLSRRIHNPQSADYKLAVSYFQRAAEEGHTDALTKLAGYYLSGYGGLSKDVKRARIYYELAALKGSIAAEKNLFRYFNTAIPPKRYDRIVESNISSADSSYKLAQTYYNSGLLRAKGINYENDDLRRAFYWFENAASKGHLDALCHVAYFYNMGWIAPKDPKKAKIYYEQAASKGHSGAKKSLRSISIFIMKNVPMRPLGIKLQRKSF